MPEQFVAEREFLRSEFDRSRPVRLIVVGLLLGFAFGRQSTNRQIEQIIGKLSSLSGH